MENAIPYCGDLHIDAATKKLIMNLLMSIRSVVPVVNPPEPEGLEQSNKEQDKGIRTQEYLKSVLVHARLHSEELHGFFNPDELLRYNRYISDYNDIVVQLETVLEEVKSCRDSSWYFASRLAELVEGHIRMISPQESQQKNEEINRGIPLSHDEFKLKIV